MEYISNTIVVKISVSDMERSQLFFTKVIGFRVNKKYTINKGGNFGMESYVQLDMDTFPEQAFSLGLYKDLEKPFEPKPQTGTVPSFIVSDIEAALHYLQSLHVEIDEFDGVIILSNTSDEGYTDRFFFFRDPDNNSFVMRQNMGNTHF